MYINGIKRGITKINQTTVRVNRRVKNLLTIINNKSRLKTGHSSRLLISNNKTGRHKVRCRIVRDSSWTGQLKTVRRELRIITGRNSKEAAVEVITDPVVAEAVVAAVVVEGNHNLRLIIR